MFFLDVTSWRGAINTEHVDVVLTGSHPGRSITDADVESLSRANDIIQGAHDFLDWGSVLPQVDVQNVGVASAHTLQAAVKSFDKTLSVVAALFVIEE